MVLQAPGSFPYTYNTTETMAAHPLRQRDILLVHPEVKQLFGFEWRTKYLAVILVVANLAIAALLGLRWATVPYWASFLVMYLLGAPINHALIMVIHECSHNLCAATKAGNRAVALFANIPLGVPGGESFMRYHPDHHSYLGVLGRDLDLAAPVEIGFVGRSTLKKAIWRVGYMLIYGLRPTPSFWDARKVAPRTAWEKFNVVFHLVFGVAFARAFGWQSVAYLCMCTVFSFGFHPCAAHFSQEHVPMDELAPHNKEGYPQETFSYYGWLNPFILNVGYHNEHHDIAKIPWTRLPQLRNIAPEFYNELQFHTSFWGGLTGFVLRRDVGPQTRIVRTMDQYKVRVAGLTMARQG
ncbi:fatty acid desaturase-domain-containing protein [Tribonema minus]|uniref:Fatty acid desaturase-domain-containing protein n=1 Tax=Tribonema minus TaxID=303371 RepID=A0A836C8G1_9STRA|nr:fatty acid desaturase-domain-containing protein [Tribonema minus]